MRTDTAFLAAADIRRVLVLAVAIARAIARRRFGSASSGNVRSMAMISARSSLSIDSAPARASFNSWSLPNDVGNAFLLGAAILRQDSQRSGRDSQRIDEDSCGHRCLIHK